MKIVITKPHIQVITLGILAGMRAMSAPAAASNMLNKKHSKQLRHSPLHFMESGTTANLLSVMAIAEFIGDKMPSAPNRIALPGLVSRGLSGALAGAGIYKSAKQNAIAGALLGGITALAATYGSFYLRRALVKQAHMIDPVIGSIEDAIVLGAGLGLTESV
ncbi:DUF4126 family protein [Mucilaginibacter mali]|uniref:DUF4126 family protein n=1 Tax=Mucilaginibacter mali TaxID=2740462 RepID=A0A7D4UP52_9SPHI|nr:DUF4126 family protein [Mucilaginibacter mali]QKJ29800.1 DUF4126 family protein [Mucilaginibacter mali]